MEVHIYTKIVTKANRLNQHTSLLQQISQYQWSNTVLGETTFPPIIITYHCNCVMQAKWYQYQLTALPVRKYSHIGFHYLYHEEYSHTMTTLQEEWRYNSEKRYRSATQCNHSIESSHA